MSKQNQVYIYGFGKMGPESKMIAMALLEKRVIHTLNWHKNSSLRVMVSQELKKLRPIYGTIMVASHAVTPNLAVVAGGLTQTLARIKLNTYLSTEVLHDLATNAETRHRAYLAEVAGIRHIASQNQRAAEIQGSIEPLEE